MFRDLLHKCFGCYAEPLPPPGPKRDPEGPRQPAVYVPKVPQPFQEQQHGGNVDGRVWVDPRQPSKPPQQTHNLWVNEQPYSIVHQPPPPPNNKQTPQHPRIDAAPPPRQAPQHAAPRPAAPPPPNGYAHPPHDDRALTQHQRPPHGVHRPVTPPAAFPVGSANQPSTAPASTPHRQLYSTPPPRSQDGRSSSDSAHARPPQRADPPSASPSRPPTGPAIASPPPPLATSNPPNAYAQTPAPRSGVGKASPSQPPREARPPNGAAGDGTPPNRSSSPVPQLPMPSSPKAGGSPARSSDGSRPMSSRGSPRPGPPAPLQCDSPKLPLAPPASAPAMSLEASTVASSTTSRSTPPPTAAGPDVSGADASAYVPLRERAGAPAAGSVHRYNPDSFSLPPAAAGAPAAPVARQKHAGKSAIKAVRHSRHVDSRLDPDDYSRRLGTDFTRSVMLSHGDSGALNGNNCTFDTTASSEWDLSVYGNSRAVAAAPKGGAGVTDSVWGAPGGGGETTGWGVSTYKSVSLLSDATTVFTNVGYDELDDAVTEVERLLNRIQEERNGEVGSFRLKGYRQRFTGRTSVVAFAEHMHGGEFALKFYCDAGDAEREFDIYRRSSELRMGLPDILDMEDNMGGVIRLRDNTALPPFLPMPRGLPLPEWYAMHAPTLPAVLQTLWQVASRLQQLHASGYCHNDVKPANILLLGDAEGRNPQWYLADYTTVAQAGEQVRARYTLEYASPELVRGVAAMRAQTIKCMRPMDIWSLGVVMFEMLTGEPFFPMDAARDLMRDGLIGLEPLHIEENPRLMVRVPKQGRLQIVVRRMLSREPAVRPNAADVVKAVRDCITEITGESPTALDEPESPVSDIAATSVTRAF